MEWEKTYKDAKKILLTLENQLVDLEAVCCLQVEGLTPGGTRQFCYRPKLPTICTLYPASTQRYSTWEFLFTIQNTGALLDAYGEENRRLEETQDTANELLDMIGVLKGTVKEQNQALKVQIKRGECLLLTEDKTESIGCGQSV